EPRGKNAAPYGPRLSALFQSAPRREPRGKSSVATLDTTEGCAASPANHRRGGGSATDLHLPGARQTPGRPALIYSRETPASPRALQVRVCATSHHQTTSGAVRSGGRPPP